MVLSKKDFLERLPLSSLVDGHEGFVNWVTLHFLKIFSQALGKLFNFLMKLAGSRIL